MDERPKWRLETIKLLEENIGRTLNYINQSKILYDPPPRVMEIKTKINKFLLTLMTFDSMRNAWFKFLINTNLYTNNMCLTATDIRKFRRNLQPHFSKSVKSEDLYLSTWQLCWATHLLFYYLPWIILIHFYIYPCHVNEPPKIHY